MSRIEQEPKIVERLDPGVIEEVKSDGSFVVAVGNALDLEVVVSMKDKKAKKIESNAFNGRNNDDSVSELACPLQIRYVP